MTNSWDDRRRALEEAYFEKQNNEALARLKARIKTERLCPVDKELLSEETFMGVVIDRCKKCNGVWLDAGEMDLLIARKP